MKKHNPKKKRRPNVPSYEQMDRFDLAIRRKVLRRGTRKYKRHREHTAKVIEGLLQKYGLMQTTVENHFRLKGTCRLIGVEKMLL